jgi:tRNA pseudouridine55 synthase
VSARRGATDLSGVLAVDKPGGCTSHDVVDRVRRITGERRVGHAGTLDPMATGLLVVLVGPATRLAPYLTAADKTYHARIAFGTQTDTDDADGRTVATAPVPDEVADPFFATGMVASLIGVHQQVPPAFSAIKVDGRTAYRSAREGDALELKSRAIEIAGAHLVGIGCTGEYAWDVELAVSKGTYIRALARDLGVALGTVAHLATLRRICSGTLDVATAHSLEAIADAPDIRALFADPFEALDLPVIDLDAEAASLVANGASLDAGDVLDAAVPDGAVALRHDRRLLAVYDLGGGTLSACSVIPGGVSYPEWSNV